METVDDYFFPSLFCLAYFFWEEYSVAFFSPFISFFWR